MQSVEADDFGQVLQQARQSARLQQAQQKAQAFLDDHPQQPADVDEDEDEEINSEEEISFVLTRGAIRNGYIRIPKTQKLFPGECVAADEQAEAQPFTLVLTDGTEIQTCLLANRGRIKARFNSLFNKHGVTEGDRVRIQKSTDRRYVMGFEQQDQNDADASSRKTTPTSSTPTPGQPLNQILYGPPGTPYLYR